MGTKTISLRDVRNHIKTLDRLVTDAWFDTGTGPAQISYADLRTHASAILNIVGKDEGPHAATAKRSPAAGDRKPVDLSAVLGVGHIRRS